MRYKKGSIFRFNSNVVDFIAVILTEPDPYTFTVQTLKTSYDAFEAAPGSDTFLMNFNMHLRYMSPVNLFKSKLKELL